MFNVENFSDVINLSATMLDRIIEIHEERKGRDDMSPSLNSKNASQFISKEKKFKYIFNTALISTLNTSFK